MAEPKLGATLRCVIATPPGGGYRCLLTMIPGNILVEMYRQHGPRLLERNVRSFLQLKGKVNQGIRKTIIDEPQMFLAFNNGLSVTATGLHIEDHSDGTAKLVSADDFQIVNGGQTTGSIFRAWRKDKVDASQLQVPVKVVRKAIRAPEGAFDYHRAVQPLPRIGPYQERLDVLLLENEARSRRDRLRMTRIHDLLKREGFEGSYDAVRRYATRWAAARRKDPGGDVPAFIPLMYMPGEAYQFDWSHEDVEIAGQPMRIKVAHVRLCASRAVYVRAYPRETQEMLFDAHARAFAFFGGVPLRGIYDNMKTAVTTVFTGKAREFNRRFLVMADHYMIEPTACSPAAGWEKGQVENQVQTIRGRFFQPRLRFASFEELNGWLEAECRRWAAHQPHPEQREITVEAALVAERVALQPMLAPFDGFHESEHAVTGTCLISFDRNRYSVMAKAVRRAVQVRAYADRIVVRLGDEVVGEHRRFFGRDRMILDPWHYLPVLARKPGALRNGIPFQGWDLPPALSQLRRKLGTGDEADRRFVRVLAAVLTDSLEVVEDAILEALEAGAASDEVILNILSRRREPPRPLTIVTPEDLALTHPPIADCARYDRLRDLHAAA